ncbi:MAG: GAF domain-containing protein [Alsobacter sp.]
MYPVPINEEARLSQLRAMNVLDSPPSPNFDRLCAIARDHYRVEIAAVSFLDAERLWFKASLGLGVREVPRDHAVCNHAILRDEVLTIPDLMGDGRFRDLPFVSGPPYLRFYAAAPIVYGPDIRLGSVCIFDRTPRTLDARAQEVLRHLAGIAVTELRLIQTSRAFFRRELAGT